LEVRAELEPIVNVLIAPISAFPAIDFARLLVQFSALPVDETSLQQVKQLLVAAVLEMRFGELGDRLNPLLSNLLMLSPEQLMILLSQLPDLSVDELWERSAQSGS
jgi:hypothetical protein